MIPDRLAKVIEEQIELVLPYGQVLIRIEDNEVTRVEATHWTKLREPVGL